MFNLVLLILILPKVLLANIQTAKFVTESVAEQQKIILYKRVGSWYFGQVPPNLVQCAFACTIKDSCKSVYIDGDACVFGVDDVTTFEEGDLVTPDLNQELKVKGKTLLN